MDLGVSDGGKMGWETWARRGLGSRNTSMVVNVKVRGRVRAGFRLRGVKLKSTPYRATPNIYHATPNIIIDARTDGYSPDTRPPRPRRRPQLRLIQTRTPSTLLSHLPSSLQSQSDEHRRTSLTCPVHRLCVLRQQRGSSSSIPPAVPQSPRKHRHIPA